jgi:hypothetical protein
MYNNGSLFIPQHEKRLFTKHALSIINKTGGEKNGKMNGEVTTNIYKRVCVCIVWEGVSERKKKRQTDE